jgi:hypothetical protein
VSAQVIDAIPDAREGILGKVDDGGARAHDLEATEAGGTGGDGDGYV